MTDPIQLVTKPTVSDDIRASLVRMFENALRLTNDGQVVCAMLIIEGPDGFWREESSGTMALTSLIGRVEIMKQGWIKRFYSDEEKEPSA